MRFYHYTSPFGLYRILAQGAIAPSWHEGFAAFQVSLVPEGSFVDFVWNGPQPWPIDKSMARITVDMGEDSRPRKWTHRCQKPALVRCTRKVTDCDHWYVHEGWISAAQFVRVECCVEGAWVDVTPEALTQMLRGMTFHHVDAAGKATEFRL